MENEPERVRVKSNQYFVVGFENLHHKKTEFNAGFFQQVQGLKIGFNVSR